jgi:hypothetical protein
MQPLVWEGKGGCLSPLPPPTTQGSRSLTMQPVVQERAVTLLPPTSLCSGYQRPPVQPLVTPALLVSPLSKVGLSPPLPTVLVVILWRSVTPDPHPPHPHAC